MNSWELKRFIPGCILLFVGSLWIIGVLINGGLLVPWTPVLVLLGGAYFLIAIYRSRYEKKKQLTGEKTSHGELISDVHFVMNQNQWSKRKLAIVCIAIFSFMLGLVLLHHFLGWLNSNGLW